MAESISERSRQILASHRIDRRDRDVLAQVTQAGRQTRGAGSRGIALKLVAGKRIDLTRVISDVFPLSELEQGYQAALAGAAGKVAFVDRGP